MKYDTFRYDTVEKEKRPFRLCLCACRIAQLLGCKLRFLASKNAEVSKNRVLLRAYQPGCVVNKSISLIK